MPTRNLISVVDPDASSVAVVRAIAREAGVQCKWFRDAERFLASRQRQHTGCLVSEFELPGMNGLELQERMATDGNALPVVFVTAHAETRLVVEAMQRGAITVLDKVPRREELQFAIRRAFHREKTLLRIDARHSLVRRRLARLTEQEHQVLELILQGKTNKFIADRLRVSLRTIESRRRQVFKKMKTDSIAQLVKLVVTLEERPD